LVLQPGLSQILADIHRSITPFKMYVSNLFREDTMNKDELKGKAKDIVGGVQRHAGKLTGDKESEAKGAAKQVAGKVQNAWGNVKDAVKN
jgi:uncharacterized protein YjbJ (UPF0337 family)